MTKLDIKHFYHGLTLRKCYKKHIHKGLQMKDNNLNQAYFIAELFNNH